MNTNNNSINTSSPVSVSVVMVLSREESRARKEIIEARNARHHIPAIQEEKKVAIKDLAREELYAGSQLGISIAFASLSNHRKELYARYGRYQIKTVYDSGDMMWHMYLL